MPGTFVDDSSKSLGIVALIVSGIGVLIAAVFSMYTYWVTIMGVFWVLIGVGLLYGVVKATVTIDETTQQLRVSTVRAYCFPGGETVYPLANVQGAELQATIGRRGKTLYRVAVHTTTGPITWTSAWSNIGVDTKTAFVQSFNQYLSSVRGGAPIILPGAAQVNVVVVAGGSGAMIAQNVPLLGAQQNPPMQQYVAYNPQAQAQAQAQQHPYQQSQPQGQYQQMPPGQYPGYQGALPPQNAQPPTTGFAATNPYAVQPNPSAPPPPYNAVAH